MIHSEIMHRLAVLYSIYPNIYICNETERKVIEILASGQQAILEDCIICPENNCLKFSFDNGNTWKKVRA